MFITPLVLSGTINQSLWLRITREGMNCTEFVKKKWPGFFSIFPLTLSKIIVKNRVSILCSPLKKSFDIYVPDNILEAFLGREKVLGLSLNKKKCTMNQQSIVSISTFQTRYLPASLMHYQTNKSYKNRGTVLMFSNFSQHVRSPWISSPEPSHALDQRRPNCLPKGTQALETRLDLHALVSKAWVSRGLTCFGKGLICIANAMVPDLLAVGFHYFFNDPPDQPRDKGNNDLHDANDQPENAKHQVKDKLQKNIHAGKRRALRRWCFSHCDGLFRVWYGNHRLKRCKGSHGWNLSNQNQSCLEWLRYPALCTGYT